MTADQIDAMWIELKVQRCTDRLDAQYMDDKITTEEYKAAMKKLSDWADSANDVLANKPKESRS